MRAVLFSILKSINFDLHAQERGGIGFALRIGLQRDGSSAIQASVEQEIQGAEIGEFEAIDGAETDAGEVALDALGGDLAQEQRVVFRLAGDEANVDRIAFVAGSG